MVLEIRAKRREAVGKGLRTLRSQGLLPAILYGHGVENTPLLVSLSRFENVYREAGESTLLDLAIDGGAPHKVIIQDVQADPASGVPLHVDFHEVRMTEKLTTEIPLNFQGESRAVKELGGVLVKHLAKVRVECLPSALVLKIPVDISLLAEVGVTIAVRDLAVPPGITLLEKEEDIVVTVAAAAQEEEAVSAPVAESERVAAVEVAERGKKEKEGEEGEGEQPNERGEKKEKKP